MEKSLWWPSRRAESVGSQQVILFIERFIIKRSILSCPTIVCGVVDSIISLLRIRKQVERGSGTTLKHKIISGTPNNHTNIGPGGWIRLYEAVNN